MDGIEWQRGKWGGVAKSILKLTEKLAAKYVKKVVADSLEIKRFLDSKYDIISTFIPYGASFPESKPNKNVIKSLGLSPYDYGLLIARIEPENKIECAIIAFIAMNRTLVIVGDVGTKYGKKIYRKYGNHLNIKFVGTIFNAEKLNALRCFSKVYYHGHSVGGTNPSLLDAMACGCIIVAHDNPFNKEVLGDTGTFFKNKTCLVDRINERWNFTYEQRKDISTRAIEKARTSYSWERVLADYLALMKE